MIWLAFLRKHWGAAAVGLAFLLLVLTCFGLRAEARHYKAQRDEARGALAVAEALGRQQAARVAELERTAQAAQEAARQAREAANADVDSWKRVAADRYRTLRLCYADAGAGGVPEARDGGATGAAGRAVPDGVGPRLVELAARADRLRNALAECYAVDDANRAMR